MTPSPASLEMIGKLIAFDTTSRNSNLRLIGFVRDHLARLGVESHLIHNADGTKANLYATLGPQDKPGIALSGHTDVVPVDGQEWASDPWQTTSRDGRLFGRGACDMKGFLGIVLTFVPELLRRELHTPIHLAFSYDEEIGCVGVRRLLDILKEMPIRPKACIIGEPTSMKVTVGHKGKKSVRCHVRGFEAHSSLAPRAVNAVEMAAEVIVYLRGMGKRFAADGAVRQRLRRAAHDRAYRRHPWRHGAQHRAEGLPLRFRVPLPAGPGRGGHVRGGAALRRGDAAAGHAQDRRGYRLHLAGAVGLSRPRHGGRQRDRGAGEGADAAATPPSRSPSAPRPGCSTRPAFPPSSAAPAASTRRTSRTSG